MELNTDSHIKQLPNVNAQNDKIQADSNNKVIPGPSGPP